MSKLSLYSVLNILLAITVMSPFALAESIDKDAGTIPEHTPPLTWDQFKESCQFPDRFHNQVPPSNITVQCTDVRREYIPSAPGQIPPDLTQGSRRVFFKVFSNKYHVDADSSEISLPCGKPTGKNAGATCMRYKEVERTLTVEKKLSCDDILNIKFSLGEYCASVLDGTKGSNPKAIDTRETGNVIDTCKGIGISAVSDTQE